MTRFPNHPARQHITITLPEKLENKRAIVRTLQDLVADLRDDRNAPRDDISPYVHDIRRVSEATTRDGVRGVSFDVSRDDRFKIETTHVTCDDAGTVRKAVGDLIRALAGENVGYEVGTRDTTDDAGRLVIDAQFDLL